jgi:hypothetical protein
MLCNVILAFSLLSPMRHPSTNSTENISSRVERDRIENFGRHQSSNAADIDSMIRTSRPYSQREFNRSEYSRHETSNLCEFVPASNMVRHTTLLHGIPLYVDQNVTLTNLMIDQGTQLAWVLSGLAKQVFRMPGSAMHLFRDVDSGTYKDVESIRRAELSSLFQHASLSIVAVHCSSIFVTLNKSMPTRYDHICPTLHHPYRSFAL